jgi:hypothetical protein
VYTHNNVFYLNLQRKVSAALADKLAEVTSGVSDIMLKENNDTILENSGQAHVHVQPVPEVSRTRFTLIMTRDSFTWDLWS